MNVTGTLNNPNNVDIMSISYTSVGYTAGSGWMKDFEIP
jgi:hypothetical protein